MLSHWIKSIRTCSMIKSRTVAISWLRSYSKSVRTRYLKMFSCIRWWLLDPASAPGWSRFLTTTISKSCQRMSSRGSWRIQWWSRQEFTRGMTSQPSWRHNRMWRCQKKNCSIRCGWCPTSPKPNRSLSGNHIMSSVMELARSYFYQLCRMSTRLTNGSKRLQCLPSSWRLCWSSPNP